MTDRSRTTRTLAVVSAGIGEPSSTRMLADRLAARVAELGELDATPIEVRHIELRPLAEAIAQASVSGLVAPALAEAIRTVSSADGLIAATPVYKASYSGLFKSFFDVVDDDILLSMPVALAATAGTPRHALVPDMAMRPLFAYLRALPTATSIFAATEDWGNASGLAGRIDRVAHELLALMQSDVRAAVLARVGKSYTRTFDGAAADAARAADDVDFDTDLMRLATGGTSRRSA